MQMVRFNSQNLNYVLKADNWGLESLNNFLSNK